MEADVLPQNIVPQCTLTQRFSHSEALGCTEDNLVRVRVRVRAWIRVWVRVAGAKYTGKNVVGHDVVGQADGNPYLNQSI